MASTVSKDDVLRKIQKLGVHDAHFQTRQLREALGVNVEEKNTRSYIHNTIQSLIREGFIKEVAGSRKRHKYYRVVDEEKLRGRLARTQPPISTNGTPRPSSPSDRLGRIESTLHALFERVAQVDAKVAQLLEAWS